ncbi:MAG: hypothetical protein HZA50_11625 [Planctomycetes bacterium]|nr:hypothetical protein [Planctomycetota bacterium]
MVEETPGYTPPPSMPAPAPQAVQRPAIENLDASQPAASPEPPAANLAQPINPLELIYTAVMAWKTNGPRLIIAHPGGVHVEFPSEVFAQAALEACQGVLPRLQRHLWDLAADNDRLKLILADLQRCRPRPPTLKLIQPDTPTVPEDTPAVPAEPATPNTTTTPGV